MSEFSLKISERLPSFLNGRLRIPAVAAPMMHVSGPELMSAVCRSGGIGSFPTFNARTPETLSKWLSQINQSVEDP